MGRPRRDLGDLLYAIHPIAAGLPSQHVRGRTGPSHGPLAMEDRTMRTKRETSKALGVLVALLCGLVPGASHAQWLGFGGAAGVGVAGNVVVAGQTRLAGATAVTG